MIPTKTRARRARVRAVPVLGAVAVLLAAAPAAHAQSAPPPPGPPPGNGGDLPAAPGTVPASVPAGAPATIPGGVPGPALVSGRAVRLNRRTRTFTLPLACRQSGTIRVTARLPTARTIASGRYRCAARRGTPALRVSPAIARRLARSSTVPAAATVRERGRTTRLDFTVSTGRSTSAPKGFWTDGHLQCSASGSGQAFLVHPDFTTATTTPISTRAWIAWYTEAGGWHWLGARGPGAGRWDAWTATPTGIAQFHPAGATAPVPWTWGPISVPAGQGIHTVGVYEIVYWVAGSPEYRWQYVNAGPTGAAAAGGGSLSCLSP